MADVLHLLPIHAPREMAYRAITTATGIREWLSRDADVDPVLGGGGEIRFAERTRIIKMEIAELVPATRVTWKVLSAAMPAWSGTEIAFGLSEENGCTMLRFAQRGFPQADDSLAMSATAWGCFLLSLKQYLETGHGTPHPDDALSRTPDSK